MIGAVEAIRKIQEEVEGMMQKKELIFLYEKALKCERGAIVEIGSAKGLSTIVMASASKAGKGAKVYSVDPHNGGGATPDPTWWNMEDPGTPEARYYINQGVSFQDFWNNVKKFGLEDIVIPIVNYSELAVKKYKGDPVELLFIDGDHRFNYVRLDLELWSPFMIPGSTVLMHDSTYPGVRRAIEKVLPRLGFSVFAEEPIFHAKKCKN